MDEREQTFDESGPSGAYETALAARHLLQWYEAMGIDEAIGDSPRDHFAEFAAKATNQTDTPAEIRPAQPRAPLRAEPPPRVRPIEAEPPASPAEALESARVLAARAQTLPELRAVLAAFDGCSLRQSAQNLVFGKGVESARLMIIGETPDREDDKTALPFSGPRGQLLDNMLRAIGIKPEETYRTHIVPWFPPGHMMPARHHIETCLPFALRQIELVQPRGLICLGWAGEALNVDKSAKGLTEFAHLPNRPPVLLLPELTEIMRSALRKRKVWDGLKLFRKKFGE